MQVPEIAYQQIRGLEGEYFDCALMHARLSVSACGERWKKYSKSDSYHTCRDCKIGAAHAGADYHNLIPATLCTRCGRKDQPLVRHQVCKACYNREGEFLAGVNRKGTYPIHAKPVYSLRVTSSEGCFVISHAIDWEEAALQTLRDHPGCCIGMNTNVIQTGQLRLI
mgnify:FL=1